MNALLINFARSLPGPVYDGLNHALGLIPFSIRSGKTFHDTYAFLQESQWWDRGRLEEYQNEQLNKLVRHCYENIPYYRAIFDDLGLRPDDIQDTKDLQKLPYLTKDIFRQNAPRFLPKKIRKEHLILSHTSGTTGKPLQFYTDWNAHQKELAFIYHQWSRVGFKPGDHRVEIRGKKALAGRAYHNYATNVLRLSPYIDSEATAIYYLQLIKGYGARYVHGYPSAIASLAYMIKKHGLKLPFRLNAVLFSSEAVYGWERALVESVFGCRAYSHYGMAEQSILAGECEHSAYYHCIPQYGITEVDPKNNELIGTGFLNYVTPLIRYRTTDIAASPAISADCCGREYYPVLKAIEGRLEDLIITPDGIISPAIITHPFKDLATIKETQIIQKSFDLLVMKVIVDGACKPASCDGEIRRLVSELQVIVGEDFRIEVERVEHIPGNSSGKFRWIISEVSKSMPADGVDLS